MSNQRLKFSIIIPTRDRFAQLAACLEALRKQDYARDRFEVIVVDDASQEPAPPAISAFDGQLNLRILPQSRNAGPGVARNIGAHHATGDFVVFTDDDCTPAEDWLARLAARFEAMPDQLIGGRVINALRENPYSTTAHVILDVVYEYYDPQKNRAHFFPTSNLALPTMRFRELGGFSEDWPLAAAEDREFCYRWIQRGLPMTYAPDAVVYHRHALSLGSFCRLHFRYGRGAYHYHRLRAGGHGEGGLKPDWSFHQSCFRYAWQRFDRRRAFQITALLGVWQVANVAGYVWQRFSFAHKGLDSPK